MKKFNILLAIIAAMLFYSSCELDRLPETTLSDLAYWNTESDLKNAANRLYQTLDGYNTLDNRSDESVNKAVDITSAGSRIPLANDANFSQPYDKIFTANNILEKGVKVKATDAIKNRYFAEAKFFRAYNYAMLVRRYGNVPLIEKTLDLNSPELKMASTDRNLIVEAMYADLDYAAAWLPTRAALPAAEYGRVTKSTAWALKARIALYEGTRAKFHNTGQDWKRHLNIAAESALLVMGQGHTLFPSYSNTFLEPGEGAANTENIFVKIYGASVTDVIIQHSYAKDLENGLIAPTRNLIRQYLYTDGLPAFETDGVTPSTKRSVHFVPEANETSFNTVLDNRDPRLGMTVFRAGELAYQGAYVPNTSLGSRSAYYTKKAFSRIDFAANKHLIDKQLIRYAEVLLIYAEAKYELADNISDADLNLTINVLRTRAGFAPKLTGAFVTANNLDMRKEIRRERTVELALEGFRYDDLIRWKEAEFVLPQTLLGAKFSGAPEYTAPASNFIRNADNIIIAEAGGGGLRKFNKDRDYLYPLPLNDINLSGNNMQQNPNW